MLMKEDELEFQARDREYIERKSITKYNKCTRFIDKFVEIIFIIILGVLGIWNFVQQFVLQGEYFNLWQTTLSVYLIGMSLMIYWSWSFNCRFLVYFGFMQGTFTKSLFFLFTACMTLPGADGMINSTGPTGNRVFSYIVAYFLGFCSILLFLKMCRNDEERIRMNDRKYREGQRAMKQPIY